MNDSTKITVTELLERNALYSVARVALPTYVAMLVPAVIEAHCDKCKRSRPFQRVAAQSGPGGTPRRLESGVYKFAGQCSTCRAEMHVWFAVNVEDDTGRKVGQWPAPPFVGSPDVENVLSDADKNLYRKAIRLIVHGYGIGACAYFRRLLEHQIGPFLQLVLEVRTAEGAPESELKAIREAIASREGDLRTTTLWNYAPATIQVSGTNPLKLLYGSFSEGIHELPEEEATSLAIKWRAALEYILPVLSEQVRKREEFAKQIKSSSSAKGKRDGP